MKKIFVSGIFAITFLACDTPEPATGSDSRMDSTVLNPNQSNITYDTTVHRDTTVRQDSLQ